MFSSIDLHHSQTISVSVSVLNFLKLFLIRGMQTAKGDAKQTEESVFNSLLHKRNLRFIIAVCLVW